MSFTPLGSQLHVRRLKAPETSVGGVIIPVASRILPSEGEVLAVGPGTLLPRPPGWEGSPAWQDQRSGTYACVGDIVLFRERDFRTLAKGAEEGVIDDDDLVALQGETGDYEPLSDYVMIRSEGRSSTSVGGIVIAQEARQLPLVGTILDYGPGRRMRTGPCAGLTRSIGADLNLPPSESLWGRTVWWSNESGFLWVATRDERDCLLVRARNLVAVEA